ncbi:MAG TPA: MurR/RpiR family transcriptional regulator [Candidatus Avipropionibacterium avicola]|uniref:MurR/RpiR family transcriptional regulator n=1 Tax=Candidatus Avipropionibacterium avicola TaxID=2840701 RepID=A0A9D1KPM1_9ACTN|nr:MurR/RpiR family transcriptional regulator [Candidatus Avipropionibacterium avicola]
MADMPTGSLLERVGSLRGDGPPSARRIAATITDRPLWAASCGIVELARTSQTSVGSVNRFCRSLGLQGYKDLRVALAQGVGGDGVDNAAVDPSGDIHPATSAQETVAIIAAASQQAISHTVDVLDLAALDDLAERLDRARLVQVVAYGGSAHVGTYLASQLTGIGVVCLSDSDVNTAASYAATLGADDVLIAVSHSGRARHAVDLVRAATAQGTHTVAITSSGSSPLAEAAQECLATTARTVSARYRGTAGRHAQLFVTDALTVRVAQRRHARAQSLLDRAGEITAAYQMPADRRTRSS